MRDELNEWNLNTENGTQNLKKKFYKLSSNVDYTNFKRHLVYSHHVRQAVNESILNKNKYKYKHHHKGDAYEYLEVSKGVILCCNRSYTKVGIFKGDLWIVESQDKVSLQCINLNDQRTQCFDQQYCKFFTLGFATTTHSSQGLTIDDHLAIHEVPQMINTDKQILYTAITRTTKHDYLNLYMDKKDNYFYDWKTGYTSREPPISCLRDGEDGDTIKFDEANFRKAKK